jgi:hypothetical protein
MKNRAQLGGINHGKSRVIWFHLKNFRRNASMKLILESYGQDSQYRPASHTFVRVSLSFFRKWTHLNKNAVLSCTQATQSII